MTSVTSSASELRGARGGSVESGRPQDDDRGGVLDGRSGLDVPGLRCMNPGIDNRGAAQPPRSTVPTTFAMRGTAESLAFDVHLHVAESTHGT